MPLTRDNQMPALTRAWGEKMLNLIGSAATAACVLSLWAGNAISASPSAVDVRVYSQALRYDARVGKSSGKTLDASSSGARAILITCS